ncbi:MAG TPA: type II toxin-antitoxin system RelE/ParE family toxin [Pirellulales bacterium]|nr:type II toxin-antitoxin system RelE/ParE family toxin [Pirellulales bacterium]
MSRRIVLALEAEREFDAAADWYESQAGLGAEFVTSVREALHRISDAPGAYGSVYRNVRCARVRRFPYNVFYRVHDDRIDVIAIIHGHRDPSIWKART